ncbi:DEAD/DEAH box helicase family protein [Pseudomonas aeruginosa]|uniref:type III restriction-modification system endonuclease n=1 Tax=Pseudomonas aeruginosa TaxID=287 RepID=UPI0022EB3B05|nr:DEAD/DEAH box helicase family protein [Pseudomonas aeruginosa]MDA3393067.1 DEAD/DEAH box helicase family protein [Pseudomonas aeruginosa]
MKLHFEPNLDYQMQAIEAVCDLFRGQEVCRTEFTVTMKLPDDVQMSLGVAQSDLGVGNRLTLLDDELLKNLADIQLRGGLPPSSSLTSGDFTVEMETGTGKTYVYLRSIFELNKRYGFTKFVIVVPSVAIKEGVYKTLQITEEHFKGLYAGVPFDYFLYDSGKPGPVRNFATSSNIQIMVVTVGAINKKDVNNLYKETEKTGGEKPIDLIKATRPIIIVDEPQSVDGGLEGRGKEALDAMNPLCTLRYSATHVDKHHMVFRLDAVDAYERKLVKQIEVASATVEDAHNKPFVRLVKVENKRGRISAKVELDKQTATGVQRTEVTVSDGDDLQQSADGRAIYADFRVGEINTAKGEAFMELRCPGGEVFLQPGQAHGDVDALAVQREMIRRTIKEHLDKEKHLRPLGIKVLSLFFIDAVDKYRQYDADGQPVKGVYAQMFEEEYRRAAKLPAYQSLFAEIDLESAAEEVHNGYFSIDKKGGWLDTAENNAGNRENAERAYNLIMKEKEKLLSFSTPLKFIFSHSALKEGWDNPNVFQICTLRDIQTERERRQTIGRGLRLCVNQDGERVRGFEVNTLTVVATENYEQFAENLQKEIEKDTGIRFGIVEQHQFAAIAVTGADGHAAPLGIEQSKALWEHLKAAGHIDAKGKVQDSLKTALKNGTLELPAEFDAQKAQIAEVLRKVSGRLDIKNADERRQVPLRKGKDGKVVYLSDEFKALWDRIKHQTTYRVQFDNAKLVTDCIAALQKAPVIAKARLQWRKADISIGKAGVAATEKAGAATVVLDEADIELPDLLTDLQDRTQLTRLTIVSILTGSGRLDDFKRNPQQFIELTAETINRCKRLALVDGIKYQKLGDQHVYAQELFEKEELTGYLKNMLLDTQKSIYEHVVYDSTPERDFANGLEKNEAIKLYAKLPGWFKVPTPLGSYNPDWAVLVEEDGAQRLYFVVETKSSLFTDDLRDKESAKIECGKAHFTALAVGENPARYVVARSVDDLLTEAAKG